MSNKSRLQTNNTNLQELIGKANALPDADSGSGDGASVETCTVEITSDDGCISACIATLFQNDEYDYAYYDVRYNASNVITPISISNVVCGSSVYVASSFGIAGFETSNCEFVRVMSNSGFFKVTANQNGVATIHCYNGD